MKIMPDARSREEFLAEMESRFAGKRHSDYQMVKTIADGTATPEQIGYLAVLFYHFTKVTPQVISTIHSRCDDRTIRRRIMDTLIDEDTELRCGSAGHDMLAMQFATRYTGLSEAEVEAHPLPQSVKDMVAYRFKIAREMPVTIALGNSGVASESHAPEMCRMISDGLREHYGVKDEDQESWIVHIEGDEEHSETALKTVLEYCTTRELQDQMLWCIDEYLKHWGNFWNECVKGELQQPQTAAAE
jgi:pyrroloquinoline quinone (PQQ) biosynthesis protein C